MTLRLKKYEKCKTKVSFLNSSVYESNVALEKLYIDVFGIDMGAAIKRVGHCRYIHCTEY